MRIGVTKTLTSLFISGTIITLIGCSPIVDSTPAGLNMSSVTGTTISSDANSENNSSVISSSESKNSISSGSISGGKGNLIIVDKDQDVGTLDDPEDPMAPSHSDDAGSDKAPEDTVIIPPVSSTPVSSATSSSAVTTSVPSSLPNSSTTASVPPATSSGSLLPSSGAGFVFCDFFSRYKQQFKRTYK